MDLAAAAGPLFASQAGSLRTPANGRRVRSSRRELSHPMLHESIFDDFAACSQQIAHDFDFPLSANSLAKPTILLRGESRPWPKTESSMKRFLVQDDGKTMKPLHYVSPFIDFEDIYVDYLSKQFATTEDEAHGFLQHYGFPTDLFDVSPCIDTARLFAVNTNPNQVGMIGAFSVRKLQNYFTVIDLSRHSFAERPRRQVAYSIKPHRGSYDLKDDQHDFGARWYRFKKTCSDVTFARDRRTLMFPSEEELTQLFGQHLRQFLESHWTQNSSDGDPYRSLVMAKLDAILQEASYR